ncbi:hypothetical protein H8S90_02885 [Olivibacter sp. SDN3]|uniref:hypothetical protein n=1 Tax=Olivibacter sp. SDN3 TaxID=2764720 RepID=UPI001650DE53|nr:hypothetical protein [Olivibacter sp. SDN3]QNL50569.1 hypothetical protein H8S90_02885 [Olivibacter sp. SDN3]
MKNSAGQILENIMDGPPIQYIHGLGKILAYLEAAVEGLKKGERKVLQLSLANGCEGLDDDFEVEVLIDDVRTASADELKHGLVLPEPDQCGPGCVC